MTTLPETKLDALLARHAMVEAELARQIAPEHFVKLSRELAEITPVVDRVKAYRAVDAEIAGLDAMIADRAKAHGKPATLCGELASTPLGALALVGLGYRSLSLVPSAIGPVKAMLLETDAAKAAALVTALLAKPDGSGSVREKLAAFAQAEGLPI